MSLPRLMLVTDRGLAAHGAPGDAMLRAIAAGVRLVQIRDRDAPPAERARIAGLAAAALPADGRLLVSGDASLARRLGGGLHLPAAASRPGVEVPRPFGRSVHGERELSRAVEDGCDYVVVGPVFETTCKPGVEPIGTDGLARIAAATTIPVFAIGGIEPGRVRRTIEAGAFGIAVRSGILAAPDPALAGGRYLQALAACRAGTRT